jgi:hypothetical protein
MIWVGRCMWDVASTGSGRVHEMKLTPGAATFPASVGLSQHLSEASTQLAKAQPLDYARHLAHHPKLHLQS